MRRKRRDPLTWECVAPPGLEDEWPYNGLSVKQELFCNHFVIFGNATEALKAANGQYNNQTTKYYGQLAYRWKKNPKISKRLYLLKEKAMTQGYLTLQAHLEALARLRDDAAGQGQFMAAVAAETQRGKAAGHYVERTELKVGKVPATELTEEELDAQIAAATSKQLEARRGLVERAGEPSYTVEGEEGSISSAEIPG